MEHDIDTSRDEVSGGSGPGYLESYDFWMLSWPPAESRARLRERLDSVGLRPTWQRMKIGMWAFTPPTKHFTPEDLFRRMQGVEPGERDISLATIYNTLNAFVDAGLLRMVTVKSGKRYYDTNTTDHYHLHDEGGMGLIDIPKSKIPLEILPELPDGYEVDEVLITVRVKKAEAA